MLLSKFINKEGQLEKSPPFGKSLLRRAIPIKRWKNRYFILYTPQEEEACLYYYKNKESRERGDSVTRSGKILLSECVDLRKQSERLFGRDFLITLTTSPESKAHKGRVFHFKTRDHDEQDEWYDALDRILRKRERKEPVETEMNFENTSSPFVKPVQECEDSLKNRISIASSGYASPYQRDSNASAFSGSSLARYSSEVNVPCSCRKGSNTASRYSRDSGCSFFNEAFEENKMMNNNGDSYSLNGFTGPGLGRFKTKFRSTSNLSSGNYVQIPETYIIPSTRYICDGGMKDRQRTHSNNQKPFPVIKEVDSDGLEVGGDKSATLSSVGRSQSDPVRTDSRKNMNFAFLDGNVERR